MKANSGGNLGEKNWKQSAPVRDRRRLFNGMYCVPKEFMIAGVPASFHRNLMGIILVPKRAYFATEL